MKRIKFSVVLLFVISLVLFSCSKDSTVSDYDGNVYQTVQIGDQLWMAENLKVTHYRNGDPIRTGYTNSEWKDLSTGAYCVYDQDPSNADTYGNLYNWYAVDDPRGLAPEGWHIPTDEEIKELEMALGMIQSEADDTGGRGTNEGSKFAGRSGLWTKGDLENDPEFGNSDFSFFPGGYRYYHNGRFYYLGLGGYFWSSTEASSGNAWRRGLYYAYTTVYRYDIGKRNGFSVRCVRSVE